MIKSILIGNTPFFICLVCGTYLLGLFIYRKSKVALFHPIIISMLLIIGFLKLVDIPYEDFSKGTEMIGFMLGPSVVALGLLLYDQMQYIKGNVLSMLLSVSLGSIAGVLSVMVLGKILGLDEMIIRSLEPKSVTTPIAMGLSSTIGGNPSLTAVTVVICGIAGAVLGPRILKLVGVDCPIAKGLSIGAAAHGLGTAKAMEMGALEGAISGLSIGLMGVITSIMIPLIHYILTLL